ncbi:MAG: rhomboid family intramembrane serine protease [Caldilineaceae bacterium]|nr:rhomboid family intramembrane serine protease [Caldilineaceae bacterium]MCB9138061.1 rhomboid family intramembrane serine protease [Caldilineaceae bacterium]
MFDPRDEKGQEEAVPPRARVSEPERGPSTPYAGQGPIGHPEFYIKLSTPRWTNVLLALNVLVFVGMIIFGYLFYNTLRGPETTEVLIIFGAKVNQLVVAGQYWRLFTAMFIHIGVLHLVFNLYALYLFGPMVERYYGRGRFLVIYLLGGLFGSLASFALSPAISAGASGAIFALIGAITVYFLRYRENFGARGRAILQNMAFIIVVNLAFGAIGQGIDNWGHIGGLLGGALIAWGLMPQYVAPEVIKPGRQPLVRKTRTTSELLWLALVAGLFLLGFQYALTITPI